MSPGKPTLSLTELPEAIVDACMAHCVKHGEGAAREILRHVRDAQEHPASARSESLLAELAARLEASLV